MRAFVIPRAGSDRVERGELPVPPISDDEVLVRVRAVGVGIHDSSFLPPDATYPYPIGIEAAGIVDEVGSRASTLAPGDRIAFVSSMQPKGGTWAERAAVRADALVVPVPSGMGFVEAAAVPVAGNTVLRAMHALPTVANGGSLFVAGGSGAIGTVAVQVARRQGWRVGASASRGNHDYLLSLGVEVAVDYGNPDWPGQIRDWVPGGVDAAIAVPPGTAPESLAVVRDGGTLVTVSGDQLSCERGVAVAMVPHQVDVRKELAQLMSDVADGVLRVEVERVYPFEQALDALAKVQTRHARGKVVLRLE